MQIEETKDGRDNTLVIQVGEQLDSSIYETYKAVCKSAEYTDKQLILIDVRSTKLFKRSGLSMLDAIFSLAETQKKRIMLIN